MVLPTLLTFLATYAFLTVAYVFTLFHLARKAGQPKQVKERKQIQSTLIPLQGEIIT
jgi:cytochrome bd-type quinol oxidase subunit 1